MREPFGVWTDGTRLVVADAGNHRVLIWNTFPTTNGRAADLVLGQPDFTTAGKASTSAASMFAPRGVYVDGSHLYVADAGNQRVLIWNTFPTVNGQAADLVLGQPDFTTVNTGATAATMSYPQAVTVYAVIAGVEAIVARPTAWQRDCLVAGREVRRFVLARFPFSVFYYCEREAVFVVAVAHGKRLPGAWRPRVGDFR